MEGIRKINTRRDDKGDMMIVMLKMDEKESIGE